MTRLIIRLASFLVALLTGVMVLIQARPYDDSELRAFLLPPEGCPAPCWQGIRPGVTTADAAEVILRSHPWVGSIDDTGGLSWNWSSQAPVFAGAEDRWNRMMINSDDQIVQEIVLVTDFGWGEMWLTYGQPTYIIPDQVYRTSNVLAARHFTAWHSEAYLGTSVEILCLPNHEPFWKAKVTTVGIDNEPLTDKAHPGSMPGFPYRDVFQILDLNACD